MHPGALTFLFTHESLTFQQIPQETHPRRESRKLPPHQLKKLLSKLYDNGECR